MDNIYIQYVFIIFLVGFAVWYIFGMIKNLVKKDSGGCSKGCGCSTKPTTKK